METHPEVSKKAISILSMSSPFFDILWPVIFDVADKETRDSLRDTHPYFHGMWKRCDDARKDAHARAKYSAMMTNFEWSDDLKLTHLAPLWYSWRAKNTSLSAEELRSFCAAADVDPASGRLVSNDGPIMVYVSRQRDLTFATTRYDALPPHANYVYALVCTGVREKTEVLETWWRGFCLRRGGGNTGNIAKRRL